MELFPDLVLGWLNGWIPLALLWLVEGGLLLLSSRGVVARLFDRSRWSARQKAFTALGKLFSLACLVLIALTPLKLGTALFAVGAVLYALGLVALVVAILNFRGTPPEQLVTRGLYRLSRHPQIVALSLILLGICLAIGSWAALAMLIFSRVLQHPGILGEEAACAEQYGDAYRAYMQRVPRYLLFF